MKKRVLYASACLGLLSLQTVGAAISIESLELQGSALQLDWRQQLSIASSSSPITVPLHQPTGWKIDVVYYAKGTALAPVLDYFASPVFINTALGNGNVVTATTWSVSAEKVLSCSYPSSFYSSSATQAIAIRYEPYLYDVVFNANGGTGSMTSMTNQIYTNTVDTLTANAFTRTGYDFDGWTTNATGVGTVFANQTTLGGEKFGVTEDGQKVNLYAKWKAHTYNVAYNESGGTAGALRPTSATYDTAFRVSAPTRTGYTFAGWKVSGHDVATARWGTGESSVSTVVADNLIATTGDVWLKNLNPTAGATVTLMAQWTAMTCTVTFSKESGSGGTSSLAINYGQTSTEFQTIEPPQRDHYKFLGYYTTASGSPDVCYFDATGKLQKTWDIAKTTCTLYARWEAKKYTVSFSPNGGTGSVPDRSVAYDETFTLPDGTAFKATDDGLVFGGWALSEQASVAAYAAGVQTSIDANSGAFSSGRLTFYVYWRNNTRTISVESNGGTASSNSFVVVIGQRYDARGPLPTATWENDKKLFTGWYTAATDGARIGASDAVPDDPPTTLYAHWTNAAYVVRFDGNGAASGTMADQTFYFDTPTELASNAFARTGYTFAGWASTNAPTCVAYADGATVTDLATYGGETIKLLAVWTTNTYYVTFDANGGSGTMPTLTNLYDRAVALPANRFTRSGFWTFAGWQDMTTGETYADGAEIVNLTNAPFATVTLQAVWKTSLSELSLAMHCDNLEWEADAPAQGTNGWEPVSETGIGHGTDSCVRQSDFDFAFAQQRYLATRPGAVGTLSFWLKMTGDTSRLAYTISGVRDTFELKGAVIVTPEKDVWTNVVIRIEEDDAAKYVLLVNATTGASGGACLIDGMTWTPDGAHPVPGVDDAVEVSGVTVTDGKLSLSFTGNTQFSYHLLATDSLSPAVWYDFGATNVGTGVTQAFDIPIDTTQSQRFFKIKTIQTSDE